MFLMELGGMRTTVLRDDTIPIAFDDWRNAPRRIAVIDRERKRLFEKLSFVPRMLRSMERSEMMRC